MYISLRRCADLKEIKEAVKEELSLAGLPASKGSSILIKPNLNSNMNALTGNTTDLRVLAGTIEFLKDSGYCDITIGEGTSSGFSRESINVFSRLMVDRLAGRYGVKTLDFNHAEAAEINFENGVKANVARVCLDADYFINMPKLKMHFETMMSVCLKNLIGCLKGVFEKQKAHTSLYKNILNLNGVIKPDFHIVDCLIAMEGTGPSSGTPVKTGHLMFTNDPYLGDLAAARLSGVPYADIPCLSEAHRSGFITQGHFSCLESAGINVQRWSLKRPHVNALVRLVNNPLWQQYIVSIRLAPGFSRFFSTRLAGRILNMTGLRQDVFIHEDIQCEGLSLQPEKCAPCSVCKDYCPVETLDMPADIGNAKKGCIECLYCYLLCPERAISFRGRQGFLSEQIRQYDEVTRRQVTGVYKDPREAEAL